MKTALLGVQRDVLEKSLTAELTSCCHDDQHLKSFEFLFSVHISYGKRKYLKRFFFTKLATHQIYIQVKGFHPKNSADVNLVSCDMYL